MSHRRHPSIAHESIAFAGIAGERAIWQMTCPVVGEKPRSALSTNANGEAVPEECDSHRRSAAPQRVSAYVGITHDASLLSNFVVLGHALHVPWPAADEPSWRSARCCEHTVQSREDADGGARDLTA